MVFQMNIKNPIKNQKLFLVILGAIIFTVTGLSVTYADSDDQGQELQNQLPIQNADFAIQHHTHNHSHLHHDTVSQNPNSGGITNNQDYRQPHASSLTTTNATTSSMPSSLNSVIIPQNVDLHRNSNNLQSNTVPNSTTSSMTSYDNLIFSGTTANVAHAETENDANGENGITPNNPTTSSTGPGYNGNNQNVMNPAKLDLVLLVTIFAITSITIHSAWKVYKTRRKFVLKKTV